MRTIHKLLLGLMLLLAACTQTAPAETPTTQPTQIVESAIPNLQTAAQNTNAVTESVTAQAAGASAEAGAATVLTTTNSVISAAIRQARQPYENLGSPVDLLASYFNAIARQEYERAYGYWQQPPLDYETFAAGYANTITVQLIVQPPTQISGAAGSLYVIVPTALVAGHGDGTVHTFAGCVVTRKSNIEGAPEGNEWKIYQAHFSEISNNAEIPALLANGCQA